MTKEHLIDRYFDHIARIRMYLGYLPGIAYHLGMADEVIHSLIIDHGISEDEYNEMYIDFNDVLPLGDLKPSYRPPVSFI